MGTRALAVAVVVLPVLGAFWLATQPLPGWSFSLVDPLLLLAAAGPLALWRLQGWMPCARDLVVASIVLGLFCLLTGFMNGLTDEANVTPQYASLLPNLYGGTLHPQPYWQYGRWVQAASTSYVYLPGLLLVYFPFVGPWNLAVRPLAFAIWLGTIYLVRRRPTALFLVGGPYAAIIAANGFNDLVVIALLTIGFVTLEGRRGKGWQLFSMGFKQPANVLDFAYWVARRDWLMSLGTVLATAAWLLPFLLLSPGGTFCHALLGSSGAACGGRSAFLTHVNYYLYPCWALAIFGPKLQRLLRGEAYARGRERARARLDRLGWSAAPESVVLGLAGILSLAPRAGGTTRLASVLAVVVASALFWIALSAGAPPL